MDPHEVPALPPDARLFHVGLMKTGTTALQRAASSRREQLRAHGVCYPGDALNHRDAVCALMGRSLGWRGKGDYVPDRSKWDSVVAEMDSRGGRGWISHEFASECTDKQAQRFVDALGDRLHVAVTLRPFPLVLASSWQQYVKTGRRKPLRVWLDDMLSEPPRAFAAWVRRIDQGQVVTRWVRLLGPERVVAVVADAARPRLLTDAFAALLEVPPSLLEPDADSGYAANRSMSWPETEMLRALNRRIFDHLTFETYERLVRSGGIARLLEERKPGPDEPAIRLPPAAAEIASERAERYVEQIRDSGCVVIGDLDLLTAPVPSAELATVSSVPLDVAVEMQAGLVSASLGLGPLFGAGDEGIKPWRLVWRQTAQAKWPDLAMVAGARMVYGLTRAARGRLSGRASPGGSP